MALRCALVEGATARCYAGDGIVARLGPAQELAETEVKLAGAAARVDVRRCANGVPERRCRATLARAVGRDLDDAEPRAASALERRAERAAGRRRARGRP